MPSLKEHCDYCFQRLGKKHLDVHIWLDGLYSLKGERHRRFRHHKKGVDQVRAMWGDEAAKAAEFHIMEDCGHIPNVIDYATGAVDLYGNVRVWNRNKMKDER